jgi:hypothetical protein
MSIDGSDNLYALCLSLSLCSCALQIVAVTSILYSKTNNFQAGQILIHSTVPTIVLSLSFSIPNSSFIGCQLQGYFYSLALLSAVIWSAISTFYLFFEISNKEKPSLIILYIIGWAFPALSLLPILGTENYENGLLFCYINKQKTSVYSVAFLVFIPYLTSCFFSVSAIMKSSEVLSEYGEKHTQEDYAIKKQIFKLISTHSISIQIGLLFGMIFHYYMLLKDKETILISIFGLLGGTLPGFISSFSYFFTISFKKSSPIIFVSEISSADSINSVSHHSTYEFLPTPTSPFSLPN